MQPNLQGALLMMGSMAAFTINDTLVKAVGGTVPLFQIITLRGAVATLLLFVLARQLGAIDFRMSRHDAGLVALRSLSEIGATYFFLTALMNMPLANVTAILQILPLSVTLGAAVFFGEQVGWRRMLAILIGFCGMLLIVRPGPDGFSPHAIYALAAVGCVTMRDLTTRRMSAQVPSLTVTLTASTTIFIVAGLASLTDDWVPLNSLELALIAGSSVFILLGYLFSVMVMRIGDVSFIAPFRYTGLIWALLLGWAVFGDWPDPITLLGATIVVSTGLFALSRERARR
ncbi:DMT family transporter [Falsiphaeobacter marinintestinus]|uniref:DMT family transporter n=1 Tax=Falsiphaeobacter marinintestinus TaxID=1492905 RepID=UPI0011B3B6A6|nr:DMT family transporter [Phaeobacter marinintestinus]